MRFFCLILMLFLYVTAMAGEEKGFIQLTYPGKVNNLPFRSVQVLDARIDTVNIGFIQTGAFNKGRKLYFGQSFTSEMEQFHQRILGEGAPTYKLLILVRNFFLSERTGSMSEKGFFSYTATYFMSTKDGGPYTELLNLDTVFICKGGMDVTSELKESAGIQLAALIGRAGQAAVNSINPTPTLTLEEVSNWEETQRQRTPLYQLPKMAVGIYQTFDELKNNHPSDTTLTVDSTYRIREFYRKGKKGKPVLIDPETVYAVCDGNLVFRSTDFGFYRFRKEGSDFYIIARSGAQTAPLKKEGPNTGELVGGAIVGGLVGVIVVSANSSSQSLQGVLCKYRIDPLNGKLIFVEVKE